MRTNDVVELLNRFTTAQRGLVTAAQAVGVGVSRVALLRAVEAGHLESVRRGIYAAAGSAPDRLRTERAVWLSLDPSIPAWQREDRGAREGVLCRRSAARAHGMRAEAEPVEVYTSRRRTTRDPAVRLIECVVPDGDVVEVDGLPVTGFARTVVDLLAEGADPRLVAALLDHGTNTGQLDPDALVPRIAPFARHYGIAQLDGERLLARLTSYGLTDRTIERYSSTPADLTLRSDHAEDPAHDWRQRPTGTTQQSGTMEQIEAAALRLFAARGFAGTGIRQIADEAGVSVATLYHYMGTKEDLLERMLERSMMNLLRPARECVRSTDDPVEQICSLVAVHVYKHGTDTALCRVADTEIRALSASRRTGVIQLRDAYQRLWEHAIEKGVRNGCFAIPDIKLASYAALEMCTGVAHWYSPQGRLPLEDVATHFTEMVLGLLNGTRSTRNVPST